MRIRNLFRILGDERGFFPLAMPAASLLMKPIVWVTIALVVSLAANWGLYKLWQARVEEAGALVGQRDQAIAQGAACSAAVRKLHEDGEARARAARLAVEEAKKARAAAERTALATLATAPSVPGDTCASADAMNREKLKGRRPN